MTGAERPAESRARCRPAASNGGRRRVLRIALAIAAAAGCATVRPAPTGTLRVTCNVADATVWIDDRLAGRAGEWSAGRPLRAGFHRIEVRHPDHFTFYAEITLRAGESAAVSAELRPLLD